MVDSTEPRIAIVWQPLESDILRISCPHSVKPLGLCYGKVMCPAAQDIACMFYYTLIP